MCICLRIIYVKYKPIHHNCRKVRGASLDNMKLNFTKMGNRILIKYCNFA